jgi:methylmalonyl-CoA carboxyltransferase 12S subunit
MAKTTTKAFAEILESVQTQLSQLSDRLERLESAVRKLEGDASQAGRVEKESPAEPAKPEITEEELITISAALAAYLGVRVRIKHIRLIHTDAWAQQGRVSIQASHVLH